MSKAVAVQQETQVPVQADAGAIISMIERVARDPQVDIDKLERLLAMQERIMAQRAKAAYTEALAAMQPKLPVITERGKIQISQNARPQTYARWEDINDAIKPVLAEYGFALSFRTGQADGKVTVTGVLSHREGHTEETTIALPLDQSGSKNAVQAVGSSTSYGKRYAASALLNLTSRGEDNDGRNADDGELISEGQIGALQQKINDYGADKVKFLKFLKVETLSDLPAKRYGEAVAALDDWHKRTRSAR